MSGGLMAWARIQHRYDDGTETEFACGSEGTAYPDELAEFCARVLGMYREIVGVVEVEPDVLREDER